MTDNNITFLICIRCYANDDSELVFEISKFSRNKNEAIKMLQSELIKMMEKGYYFQSNDVLDSEVVDKIYDRNKGEWYTIFKKIDDSATKNILCQVEKTQKFYIQTRKYSISASVTPQFIDKVSIQIY